MPIYNIYNKKTFLQKSSCDQKYSRILNLRKEKY